MSDDSHDRPVIDEGRPTADAPGGGRPALGGVEPTDARTDRGWWARSVEPRRAIRTWTSTAEPLIPKPVPVYPGDRETRRHRIDGG